jgi:bacillithiol synthase
MFKKTTIPFKNSGVLNDLVRDYLEQKNELRGFYNEFPDEKGFLKTIGSNPYSQFKRKELVDILSAQHKLVKNTTKNTFSNIHKLANKNCYTVTTGHQLCLFTGPLYFVHKIISTIKLAESLKHKFSDHEFVPVYWMASEDHDFEEVNHFHYHDKKIKWESKQTGAVGHFDTRELTSILQELKNLVGKSVNADRLTALFEEVYLQHANLSGATRYLVNELFGKFGLIVVDGNDKQFKKQFTEYFKKDIFENLPFNHVNQSNEHLLKLGYHVQVNPRRINSFFLEKDSRTRIDRNNLGFVLTGTQHVFTENELEQIINDSPEKISPNVVTRPLYQQTILPNLAYVGGPGELAYWLQYKQMFDALKIFFPLLVPRNFVTIIDPSVMNRMQKLNFSESDVFKSENDLIRQILESKNISFDTDKEKKDITGLFLKLNTRISELDPTLKGKVSAVEHRVLKGLDDIAAKAIKAHKRKISTETEQIKKIKESLFPGNLPQERYENFSSFYLQYGDSFFDELKDQFDPFSLEHIILHS